MNKEFIKGKTALYLIATEESEHENKKTFQRILGDFTQNPLLKKDLVLEWEEIFSLFVNNQPDQKKPWSLMNFNIWAKATKDSRLCSRKYGMKCYRNYLELDNTDMVLQKLSRNFRDNHVSFVYENICREKLMDMSARGDLGFIISTVGKWWDKHTEIDIVGLSHKADDIIFAECKYTRSQMGIDDYFKLKKNARKVIYPPDARTHYALFSKSGFTPELLTHKKNDPRLMLIQG